MQKYAIQRSTTTILQRGRLLLKKRFTLSNQRQQFSTTTMSNNKTMRAVQIKDKGVHATDMYISDVDIPVPKPDEVLIKVQYTALNRADISQRKGMYPPPKGASEIMGLEVAGTVYQLGENAQNAGKFKQGDRVIALLDGGGYAQYATAHKDVVISVPSSLELEDAVCIPEVYLTAYQTFFYIGKLVEHNKKRVLIHTGASGVGSALTQLCKSAGCSHIITTSSSGKTQFCKEMGATHTIAYDEVPDKKWSESVLRACPDGVDLILDPVGGDTYLEQDIAVTAVDGSIIGIAFMGGTTSKNPIDLRRMLARRITITYSTLRSRTTEYKIDLTREFLKYSDGLKKFETGELKCIKHKVFNSLDEISEAHKMMETNQNTGKIVVKVQQE
jgi:tumor protein p53-inducible protein 3